MNECVRSHAITLKTVPLLITTETLGGSSTVLGKRNANGNSLSFFPHKAFPALKMGYSIPRVMIGPKLRGFYLGLFSPSALSFPKESNAPDLPGSPTMRPH